MNKPFIELLDRARAIHQKKNEDYTQQNNPHENFERMALIQEWFKNPIDKPYAGLIALKLARLATLLNKQFDNNGAPNNEPIDDTFLDQFVYTGLWYGNYVDRNKDDITKPIYPGDLTYKVYFMDKSITYNCFYCMNEIKNECIMDNYNRVMHENCIPR